MTRPKIDWAHHLAEFRLSPQTIDDYCAAANLKPGTFRYHLYKMNEKKRHRTRFKEFSIASALVIARDERGQLTLSGFDCSQLPQLVGAWSDALSE